LVLKVKIPSTTGARAAIEKNVVGTTKTTAATMTGVDEKVKIVWATTI